MQQAISNLQKVDGCSTTRVSPWRLVPRARTPGKAGPAGLPDQIREST